MNEPNPFAANAVHESPSLGRALVTTLFCVYSFLATTFATFMLAFVCPIVDGDLLSEWTKRVWLLTSVGGALIVGVTGFVFSLRWVQSERASRATIFSACNAILALAFITLSVTHEFRFDNFKVFPIDSDSFFYEHYIFIGLLSITGIFGFIATIREIRAKRMALAAAVGAVSLACMGFIFYFFTAVSLK